ncbi:MAG: hypothetical protein IVW53_13875 [Chloroflexi bacterium]|nr:hypothetical protein [Chloroflexota bacterium]
MRHLIVTLGVATILAACGGSAAPPSPAPTATPAVATAVPASPTAPPTAAPTETPPASSALTTSGPGGSGAFVVAGLTSMLPVSADQPDSSTFATSFASETPEILVAYQLAPGLAGKITSIWRTVGGDAKTTSFDYPASAPWAYFSLTYVNGFVPGDYEEILTFERTGESVTLPFTITGPRRPPATPTPLPSGTSAFTLLRTATGADSSKSRPDPATFTDSFPTTAPAIFVVFSLRPELTGKVTCTMTANGSALIKPLSIDYGTRNSWGDFKVNPAGEFSAGDYVATVTYTPTGEAQTVRFTVK